MFSCRQLVTFTKISYLVSTVILGIRSCDHNNGGCEYMCLNLQHPKEQACLCKEGLRLTKDGKTCEEVKVGYITDLQNSTGTTLCLSSSLINTTWSQIRTWPSYHDCYSNWEPLGCLISETSPGGLGNKNSISTGKKFRLFVRLHQNDSGFQSWVS